VFHNFYSFGFCVLGKTVGALYSTRTDSQTRFHVFFSTDNTIPVFRKKWCEAHEIPHSKAAFPRIARETHTLIVCNEYGEFQPRMDTNEHESKNQLI
jgi:hypothetical protein